MERPVRARKPEKFSSALIIGPKITIVHLAFFQFLLKVVRMSQLLGATPVLVDFALSRRQEFGPKGQNSK